jgi:crotonobetainyl-CoA:carnitine CoA-transferase CaiB-like acyl-CoA transferase
VVVPKASYQMSETKAHIHSPPPRFGQHTDEVLTEMGFSKTEIADMRAKGIV